MLIKRITVVDLNEYLTIELNLEHGGSRCRHDGGVVASMDLTANMRDGEF
jgi:hypothetical protein